MNNIEKFQKIKKLSHLKSELHKRELLNLVTFNSGREHFSKETVSYLELGKTGFTFYKAFKSFFQKQPPC